MATYNGIFTRSALGQSNTVPRSGAQSNSPDIIPYGTSVPPKDAQIFFKENYNQDVGKALLGEQTNNIYLRGKNYATTTISDDVNGKRPQLYWTKASLLSYPDKWTELTKTASHEPVSMTAGPGEIGVISEPLLWVPDNITADHYCMIATVPSPGYDNAKPNTLYISDFASWVAKSGGVAWRNVTLINSTTLTLTGEKLYYEQGEEASLINFNIKCYNVPIGTLISFYAPISGPTPPIKLEPTTVSTFPNFTSGLECEVPANYVSDVFFNLQAPAGVTSLPDARVVIQATVIVPAESELYAYAKTRAELGIPNVDEAYGAIWRQLLASGGKKLEPHHEQYLEQLTDLYARQKTLALPDREIIVGQNNYDWKKK